MGYGNGYPLFNFYNPLPFYIGGILSFLLGFIGAAKALFLIAAILGGVSMYFLSKELFGKEAGFVSAILYQFVPYKALDLYVRGALAESFAISVVPFAFLFCLKLINSNNKKYFIGLTLSLAALFTSHNIMTIFFLPTLLLFAFFSFLIKRSKNIFYVLLSFLLGFGLSAFFIIPSFFEKNLVQIDNLVRLDLDFRAHFVNINQLFFDRFWGYGASSPGSDDTISFQIGWPHWWLVIISAIMALIYFKKRSSKHALLLLGIFVFAVFMTHIRSAFVWESINILKFAQFPWRFLSVAIFSASLLGGYIVSVVADKFRKFVIVLIVSTAIFFNFSFFKPDKFYTDLSDQQKLSGELWEEQQKAAILDYLPQSAVQPREPAPPAPVIKSGRAEVSNFINRSNKFSFNINVLEKTEVEIPVFDFPNWQIKVNKKYIQHTQGRIGRIAIYLDSGEYYVEGRFENTLIRNLANCITVISFIILLVLIFKWKRWKNI